MSVIKIRQIKTSTHDVPPFKVTQGCWTWHGPIGCLWLTISDPS